MEEGLGSSSSAIDSSNIGFRLLKKQGWKEGTGLGIAKQGRLEPLQPHVKNNKRGLGADKTKKKCVKLLVDSSTKEHNNNVSFSDFTGHCGLPKEQVGSMTLQYRVRKEATNGPQDDYPSLPLYPTMLHESQDHMASGKKSKALSKRMRKLQEEEKRMQEKEFDRAFFREFWPDNV